MTRTESATLASRGRFSWLKRLGIASLAVLAWQSSGQTLLGQQPHAPQRQAESVTTRALSPKWRRSERVRPVPPSIPNSVSDVFARPARAQQTPRSAPRPVEPLAAASHAGFQNPMRSPGTRVIRQAAFTQDSGSQSQGRGEARGAYVIGNYQTAPTRTAPMRTAPTRTAQAPGGGTSALQPVRRPDRLATPDDFFNNPFASDIERPTATQLIQPTQAPVAEQQNEGMGLPETPPNLFRDGGSDVQSGNSGMALPDAELPPPADAAESNPRVPGDSMREQLSDPAQQDTLRENTAPPEVDRAQTPPVQDSPSDRDDDAPFMIPDESNPFDRRDSGADIDLRNGDRPLRPGNTSAIQTSQLTCDEFRERVAREKLNTISLDPSPPFRPDLFDPADYEKQRERFERLQKPRDWSTPDGRVVARGKLLDIAYEQVIIETEDGTQRELPVKRLSEGDLGYLSENWGLPEECLIEQVAYTPRSWAPMTMTYKASNACSKPRYFEEVNLERYGHTVGPYLQPLVSSAHFFGNVMVLPYKMGIHPPHECQYALGYYRPGNCAPWIVPPVPVSARGAISQAAVMTGSFWLIP